MSGEARMGCCWGPNALISEITLSLISSSEHSSMYLELNKYDNLKGGLTPPTLNAHA